MKINRQPKQFGLSGIGINRVQNTTQSISSAVIEGANALYARSYEIAKEEAIERGGKMAAELELDEITTLDPATKVPVAMKHAGDMGRFSKDAFERITLQRFEGAVKDDIAAKKAELLQKVGGANGSPEQFQKLFGDYLDGLGQNASGFYKQVIVDNGAHHMEDATSRLKLARIARAQAAAKQSQALARKRAIIAAQEAGYNARKNYQLYGDPSGVSGDMPDPDALPNFNAFYSSLGDVKNGSKDLRAIGVGSDESDTEFEYNAYRAFAAGQAQAILNNPNVAIYSGEIEMFLENGATSQVFELLSPRAQTAASSLLAAAGADSPFEAYDLSKLLKEEIANSKVIGKLMLDRADAANKAQIQAQKDALTYSSASLSMALKENVYGNTGIAKAYEYQNFPEGMELEGLYAPISELDSLLDGVSPATVGIDAYKSMVNMISEAKAQYAEGLLNYALNDLQYEETTANSLAKAIKAGNIAYIVDNLPVGVNNVIASLSPVHGDRFGKTIENWMAGEKVLADAEKAKAIISMNNSYSALSGFLASDDNSFAEKEKAVQKFDEAYGSKENISKEYLVKKSELAPKIEKLRNADNAAQYARESAQARTNVTQKNLQEKIRLLKARAKDLNVSDEALAKDVQAMVDSAARSDLTAHLQKFVYGEMNSYAERKTALDGLSAALSGETVDLESMDGQSRTLVSKLINQKFDVNGFEITPSIQELAGTVTSFATRLDQQQQSLRELKERRSFNVQVEAGTYARGATTIEGRNKYVSTLKEKYSIEGDVTDLLMGLRLPEEGTNEMRFIEAVNRNKNIVPQEYSAMTNQFLAGTLNAEQSNQYMAIVHSQMIETGIGKTVMSPGMKSALGNRASQVETLYKIYTQYLPGETRDSVLTQLATISSENMTEEEMQKLTGQKKATSLLDDAGVPVELWNDIAPAIPILARHYGRNLEGVLSEIIESRYSENANYFDPVTNSSSMPYSPEFHNVDPDILFAKLRQIQLSDPDLSGYFFNPNNSVSIEEARSGTGIIGSWLGGTIAQDENTRRKTPRLIIGPTRRTSAQFAEYQFYAVDAFGQATVVPNTAFDAKELTRVEETNPFEGIKPVNGKVPEKEIMRALPEDVAEEIMQQSEPSAFDGKAYTGPTRRERILVSENAIKLIKSQMGLKSEATKLLSDLNSMEDIEAKNVIRKVIRSVKKEANRSEQKEILLNELYEVSDSLWGR